MAQFNYIHCTTHFRHFRPMGFGYDVCPPKYTGGLRIPNCWALHYVFSGTGVLQTGGRTYHPQAGDLFVIHPYQPVFDSADETDPWTYVWFDFHGDTIPAAVLQQNVLREPRLEPIFRTAYEQSSQYQGAQLDAFLYGKLAELFGMLELLHPGEEKPSDSQIIQEAIQYMHRSFPRRITVQDIAAHVYMEYFNFIAFFHDHLGISPGRYLANLRMGEAIAQMLQHGKSIRQVAEMLEYNDVASFARAFKKHFGMTPRQYIDTYGIDSRRHRD